MLGGKETEKKSDGGREQMHTDAQQGKMKSPVSSSTGSPLFFNLSAASLLPLQPVTLPFPPPLPAREKKFAIKKVTSLIQQTCPTGSGEIGVESPPPPDGGRSGFCLDSTSTPDSSSC